MAPPSAGRTEPVVREPRHAQIDVRVIGVLATATALALVLNYLYTPAFVTFLVLAILALIVAIFGR
jgi:hypothetical protein